MVARLIRMLPLLVILAVLAGIIYLVVSYRESPNRAKEVLIKSFLVITGALSAFFLLISLYALLEQNSAVFDLFFAFFVAAAICLVITLICRYVFLKHHPNYRKKRMKAEHRGGKGGRGAGGRPGFGGFGGMPNFGGRGGQSGWGGQNGQGGQNSQNSQNAGSGQYGQGNPFGQGNPYGQAGPGGMDWQSVMEQMMNAYQNSQRKGGNNGNNTGNNGNGGSGGN